MWCVVLYRANSRSGSAHMKINPRNSARRRMVIFRNNYFNSSRRKSRFTYETFASNHESSLRAGAWGSEVGVRIALFLPNERIPFVINPAPCCPHDFEYKVVSLTGLCFVTCSQKAVPAVLANQNLALVHILHDGLYFTAVVSTEIPPLVVMEYTSVNKSKSTCYHFE